MRFLSLEGSPGPGAVPRPDPSGGLLTDDDDDEEEEDEEDEDDGGDTNRGEPLSLCVSPRAGSDSEGPNPLSRAKARRSLRQEGEGRAVAVETPGARPVLGCVAVEPRARAGVEEGSGRIPWKVRVIPPRRSPLPLRIAARMRSVMV